MKIFAACYKPHTHTQIELTNINGKITYSSNGFSASLYLLLVCSKCLYLHRYWIGKQVVKQQTNRARFVVTFISHFWLDGGEFRLLEVHSYNNMTKTKVELFSGEIIFPTFLCVLFIILSTLQISHIIFNMGQYFNFVLSMHMW